MVCQAKQHGLPSTAEAEAAPKGKQRAAKAAPAAKKQQAARKKKAASTESEEEGASSSGGEEEEESYQDSGGCGAHCLSAGPLPGEPCRSTLGPELLAG